MITIFGKNCVYEALRAKSKLDKVLISDLQSKKDKNIIDILKKNGVKFEIVEKTKLDSKYKDNQGYVAFREDYKIYSIEDLNKFRKDKGRILILDGVQDPHNFGAIIRSVDAFGYDLIILPNNRSVRVTEVVAHVSTGAIEYTPIMYVNSLLTAVQSLKDMGYWIVGTDATGTTLAKDIDKNLSLAVIIGSEGFGMSKTLVKQSDFLLQIPMVGHVNSLNASVSAGIVLNDLKNY